MPKLRLLLGTYGKLDPCVNRGEKILKQREEIKQKTIYTCLTFVQMNLTNTFTIIELLIFALAT